MASKIDMQKRLANSSRELDDQFKRALDASVEGMTDSQAKELRKQAQADRRARVALPPTGSVVKMADIFAGTEFEGHTGVVTPTPAWVKDTVAHSVIVAFDATIGRRKHYAVRAGYLTVIEQPKADDDETANATEDAGATE